MATFTSLTVNDRATTPVAHTYVPYDRVNGVAILREASAVTTKADKFVKLSLRGVARKRARIAFSIPTVSTETLNGIDRPKLERTAYAECVFTFEDTSTLQERKDIVGQMANILAASQTMVDDLITGLNPVAGS